MAEPGRLNDGCDITPEEATIRWMFQCTEVEPSAFEDGFSANSSPQK
jgi:hypothetical protein